MSKVRLLGTRSWQGLKGITDAMGLDLNRILAEGMVDGRGAVQIAKDMMKQVGFSRSRAMTFARTEIINAHAEGQLDAFGKLGIEELGVMAEWSTAGDDRVCERCFGMEGQTFDIKEARGLIPLHPNCRCSWIPSDPRKSKPKETKEKSGGFVPLPREVLEAKLVSTKAAFEKAKLAKSSPEELVKLKHDVSLAQRAIRRDDKRIALAKAKAAAASAPKPTPPAPKPTPKPDPIVPKPAPAPKPEPIAPKPTPPAPKPEPVVPKPEPAKPAKATPTKYSDVKVKQGELRNPEYDALVYYQGSGFRRINDYLRSGHVDTSTALVHPRTLVQSLDSALAKSQLQQDVVVYRGYGRGLNLAPGKVWHEKGYLSTTSEFSVADDFGGEILEIHVPKGKQEIHMGKAIRKGGEKELLFGRDSRLIISEETKVINGTTVRVAYML